MIASFLVFLFFTHVLVFILSFLSLLCHCSKVMICMYVCYMLFNKYSVLNYLSLLILYLSCRWIGGIVFLLVHSSLRGAPIVTVRWI